MQAGTFNVEWTFEWPPLSYVLLSETRNKRKRSISGSIANPPTPHSTLSLQARRIQLLHLLFPLISLFFLLPLSQKNLSMKRPLFLNWPALLVSLPLLKSEQLLASNPSSLCTFLPAKTSSLHSCLTASFHW